MCVWRVVKPKVPYLWNALRHDEAVPGELYQITKEKPITVVYLRTITHYRPPWMAYQSKNEHVFEVVVYDSEAEKPVGYGFRGDIQGKRYSLYEVRL